MINQAMTPTKTYTNMDEYKAVKSAENEAYAAQIRANEEQAAMEQVQQDQAELEGMQKINKEIDPVILEKIRTASTTKQGEYISPGSEFSPRSIVQDVPTEADGVNPLVQRDIGRQMMEDKFGKTSIPSKAEFEVFSVDGDKITNDYDPSVLDRTKQVLSTMRASGLRAGQGISLLLDEKLGMGTPSDIGRSIEDVRDLNEEQLKQNIFSREVLVRNNTSGKIERKTYGDLASGANKLSQGLIESLPENVLIAIASMYTGGMAGAVAAGAVSGGYYGAKTTGSEYINLREKGYNKTTAFRAALAQGATEAALEGVAGAATTKMGSLGNKPTMSTAVEAGTEASQQLASNLINQNIGQDVDTFEGVGEAALMGGISSQLIKGVLGPIGKARIKGKLHQAAKGKDSKIIEMAQQDPEILRATLIDEYKFTEAEAGKYVGDIITANPVNEEVKQEEVVKPKPETVAPKETTETKPPVVKTESVDTKDIKPKVEPVKKPKTESKKKEAKITKVIDNTSIKDLENSSPEFKELVTALDNKTPMNKVKRSLITDENMKNYGILKALREGEVDKPQTTNWVDIKDQLQEAGTVESGSFILAYDGDNVSIKPKKDKRAIPATVPMSMIEEMREDKSIGTLYNDEVRGDARYVPKTKQLEQALGGTPLTQKEKDRIRAIDVMANSNAILENGALSPSVTKSLDAMSNKNLSNLITSMHTDPNYSPLEKVNIMNYNNERRGRATNLTEADLPKGMKPDAKKTKKKDDDNDIQPPSSGGGPSPKESTAKLEIKDSDSDLDIRKNINTVTKSTEAMVDSAIKTKDGKSIGEMLNNLVQLTKSRLYDYNTSMGKSVRRIYSKIRHLARQLGDEFADTVNAFVFNPKNGVVTAFVEEGSGIDGSITPVLSTVGDPVTGVKVIEEGDPVVNPYSNDLNNIDYESVLSDEGLSDHNRTTILGLMNIKENTGLDIRVHNDEYMNDFALHVKELSEALNDVIDGDYNGAITEVTDKFKKADVDNQRKIISDVITENKDKGESIVAKGEKIWGFAGATSAKFNSPHHLFGIMGDEYKNNTFDKYHTATNKYLFIKQITNPLNAAITDKATINEFKKYGSMNLHDVVEGDIVNSNTGKAYKDGDIKLTFDDLLMVYNFDIAQNANSTGLYNFQFQPTGAKVISLNTMQLVDIMDKVDSVLKTNPNLKKYSTILTDTMRDGTKAHNTYETVRKLTSKEKVGLFQGDFPIKVAHKVKGVGKGGTTKSGSDQAQSARNNYNVDAIDADNRLFIIEPSSIATNTYIERIARINAYEDVLSEIKGYMNDADLKESIVDRMGKEGYIELDGWYEKLNTWYNGAIGESESQRGYKVFGQMLKSSFVRTNLTANPYVVAKQAASVEMGAVAFSNIADVNIVKTNLQLAKNVSTSTIRRTGAGAINVKDKITSKTTENNVTRTNDFITDWYNEYAPQIQQRMENQGSYEMREIREKKKKGTSGVGAPLTTKEKISKYTIGLGSDVSDLGMRPISSVDMSVMDGSLTTAMQITRDKYRASQKVIPKQINNLINNLATGVTVPSTVLSQMNEYMSTQDKASIDFFKDTAKLLDEVVIVSQPAIERHVSVGARDANDIFSWMSIFGGQRTVTHAYVMELADNVHQRYVNGDLDKNDALKEMLKLILVGLIGGGLVIGSIDETRDALENPTSAALRDPETMIDRTVSSIAGNNYITGVGYKFLDAQFSNDRMFTGQSVMDITIPHLDPLKNLGEAFTDVAVNGANVNSMANVVGVAATIPTGLPIPRALKYLNLVLDEQGVLEGAAAITKIDMESDPVKRQDLVIEYIQDLQTNEIDPDRLKKLKYQLAQAKGKRTKLIRKSKK